VRLWLRVVVTITAERKKQRRENENHAHLRKQTPVLEAHPRSICGCMVTRVREANQELL